MNLGISGRPILLKIASYLWQGWSACTFSNISVSSIFDAISFPWIYCYVFLLNYIIWVLGQFFFIICSHYCCLESQYTQKRGITSLLKRSKTIRVHQKRKWKWLPPGQELVHSSQTLLRKGVGSDISCMSFVMDCNWKPRFSDTSNKIEHEG